MSRLTLALALICAFALSAFAASPASALSANEAPRASRCGERVSAPSTDAARIAFLRSLAQSLGGKQPGKPMNTKMPRTECTSDGPITTCCGSCGCCTWTPESPSPNCKSWC